MEASYFLKEKFLKDMVYPYRDELEIKEIDRNTLELRDTRIVTSFVFKTNSLIDFMMESLEKYGVKTSKDSVLDYRLLDINLTDWKGTYVEFVRREYVRSKQFYKDNTTFKWYNDKGFQQGNYAEFFLHYEPINSVSLTNLVRSFNIGTTHITIGRPSSMFKVIKDSYLRQQIDGFEHEIGWDNITTVKLEKITTDCENLLQQVLYIISKYTHSNVYPSIKSPYSKNEDAEGYYKKVIHKDRSYLKKANYIEPIMYYNLAKNENTTGKILNYYKAVEFFFDINRDEALVNFVQNYGHSVSTFELKSELQKLLDAKEQGKLIFLFENIKYGLYPVLTMARENKLIDSDNIGDFAKSFYKKRNQLVHSRDKNNILRILSSNDLVLWASIFEKVAEVCINYFCFVKE
ncbi:hypothetical protein [Bacillus cereus]|uniref:hypothetical protein n=1 Tax=Bacillus cereus TaxID=1396 RepID=UPI0024BC3F05|nr:hypothetical protein [Bacillus cereus]